MIHILLFVLFCSTTMLHSALMTRTITSKKDEISLWNAININDIEKIKELLPQISPETLNACPSERNSALTFAVFMKLPKIVELFIQHGADVNLTDAQGWTPLEFATQNADTILADMLLENNADLQAVPHILFRTFLPQMAQFLIDKGLQVNARNREEKTLLIPPIQRGYIEFTKFLIVAGCPLDAQDKLGRTALMWAVIEDRPQIAQLLIAAGADTEIINTADWNRKALDWARFQINKDEMQQAFVQGKEDFLYYQEQKQQIAAYFPEVLLPIIYNYSFGDAPTKLVKEVPKNSSCTIL